MPKDLFNLEEHLQREANSAWNALVDATYKRICWVCQSQVGGGYGSASAGRSGCVAAHLLARMWFAASRSSFPL